MNTQASAYPLTWPAAFPRAKVKEPGRFKATLAASLKNVQDSLRLFASDSGRKLESVIISSNVTLGASKPADPGVAVWFVWDQLGLCIAVDRYQTVEANLQAIHHILEARRVELRHGTLALVRATFQGFKALPAPPEKSWRTVLGVSATATRAEAETAYKRLRSESHPDKGGDADQFNAVTKAWEQAQGELS